MDRLTIITDIGLSVIIGDKSLYPVECYDCCIDNKVAKKLLEDAIAKLAEYEDLEEQGKLLKLPVAVGDAVYWVNDWFYDGKIGLNHENHITESKVSRFFYNDLGLFMKLKNGENIPVSDFNKTVFLTKSAAEQALKEMEGNNGN